MKNTNTPTPHPDPAIEAIINSLGSLEETRQDILDARHHPTCRAILWSAQYSISLSNTAINQQLVEHIMRRQYKLAKACRRILTELALHDAWLTSQLQHIKQVDVPAGVMIKLDEAVKNKFPKK